MKKLLWTLSALCLMGTVHFLAAEDQVTAKARPTILPTYEVGPPDLNATYFTGRVYQGAQGHTYPYAMYDVLTDNKVNKEYNGLYLENKYLEIAVLPEMGGRILQATDKTNQYEFFYRQHVVKPALIGMLGAWMSGGVEWNIPHHHRPSSFMAVDWKLEKNDDGSKTIWVGETELRHRMKWSVGLTLHPGRSYLEAKTRIDNRSALLQSMLCWANVSVHCNEDYEVIFPPSVQHGTDHAKIKFCDWPINKGIDYRFWKNHTDQFRSVFAWDFENDFLAGYDHGKEAGTVHVANHHIVNGKKFFLWGNHDRAKMWDQMLTDEDGCYLELMVGAWSDNQPDYSWIAPGEVREFKQFWYPIKGIRNVKNATLDAAVNLERTEKENLFFGFCVTGTFENAVVELKKEAETFYTQTLTLTPEKPFLTNVKIPAETKDSQWTVVLKSADGKILVQYTPQDLEPEPEPEIVTPTPAPKEIPTNEELYLAGLRIEQFHNARLNPMDYYEEALRRDPMDGRVNTAVGLRYARLGKWELAEKHLKNAIARLGKNYTVLKEGEPHYILGHVLQMQGELKKAKDQYWKAVWTTGYQSAAYFALAQIACLESDYVHAVEMADESIRSNTLNTKVLTVKAYALRKLGKTAEAQAILNLAREKEALDCWSSVESTFLPGNPSLSEVLPQILLGDDLIKLQEMLEMAVDYGNMGANEEAMALLKTAISLGKPYANSPLPCYYAGLYSGDKAFFQKAANLPSDYCFPFRVEELALFETVLKASPNDSFAWFYYGNLLYYLEQKEAGIAAWEKSVTLNPTYGRAWRNLGFAYNRTGNIQKAIAAYETGLRHDTSDPKPFTELDILHARVFKPAAERLAKMEKHLETILKHDDAVIRLLGLYNETGNYQKAIDILDKRHFHVWEGGRTVHDIFVDAHLLRGIHLRDTRQYDAAMEDFAIAQTYPANLEVGRVMGGGQNAKIFYFLATTLENKGDRTMAAQAYETSAATENAPREIAHELTYFRIESLKKLGKVTEARKLQQQFATAVEKLLRRDDKSDEFSKFGEDGTATERRARLYYLQGLVSLAADQKGEAENFFEKALQLNPNMIWPKIIRTQP